MKFLTSIDLLQNELQNAVIQPLAAAPSSATEGQIYYNSTDKYLYRYDGATWGIVGKEYTLPIASNDVLGGVKVGGGLQITENGVLSATGGGVADSVEWSGVLDTPTDLAGYGITDAKIENGVITLGKTTITPVTSVNGKTGEVTLTKTDVGLDKVANVLQYSAENEPPYPVTSVDGETGAVVLSDVKYTAQTLTEEQKTQARTNIGAGTSSFSGSYNDLTDKPVVDTEMKADSTNAVQNKVIKAYVDGIVAASQGVVYKGVINKVEDIPTTYDVGWLYMIGTAGTYVGQECEVGDLMIAVVARKGTGNQNSDWDVVQTNINGAITEITGDSPISVTGAGASREIALENSGVTTGGYGDTTAQTPAFGATFKVPSFTVDQYGRLTAAGEHTVTIPATVATDAVAGIMSAADHKKLTDGLADVATLKDDVAALKTKDVTKVTATITAGQTTATATVASGVDLLSTMATNATTGEQVMVDTTISGTTFTATIAKAVGYNVKVVATVL